MRAGGCVLWIAAALIAAGPAWAQTTGGADSGAQQPGRLVIQLVPVRARLETYLDGKRAKAGEAIRARLEASVAIPHGPTLPQNTILQGHVDQAQASEHHSDSSVVVTFDEAKLRNGEIVPVKVTILAIAAPASPVVTDEATGAQPGSAAGTGGSTGPTRPADFIPPSGTVRDPAAPQAQQGPAQIAETPPASRGLPGVTLKSDIHASVSATFLAARRNVHVPDGTEMQVAVGVIPRGVQLQ